MPSKTKKLLLFLMIMTTLQLALVILMLTPEQHQNELLKNTTEIIEKNYSSPVILMLKNISAPLNNSRKIMIIKIGNKK